MISQCIVSKGLTLAASAAIVFSTGAGAQIPAPGASVQPTTSPSQSAAGRSPALGGGSRPPTTTHLLTPPSLHQPVVTRENKGSSVMGLDTGAAGSEDQIKVAAPNAPSGSPVENYYGDSPAGAFESTDRFAGAAPNAQDYGPTSPVSLQNPNNVTAESHGPVANGTGERSQFVQKSIIEAPVEETGATDNPQESYNAFMWIMIGTVATIGSVWGLIRRTQPGGQV